ncbi:MAG: ferritin [marine benthic group bacterium]|jgi:ferritin|nr:ferritin [Gemmatimonadota bacterium]MCL7980391.1 ferritin [Gemmatimonadota bacterium]
MISDRLRDEINEQIKYEMYSAYMYLAMSAWCAERNLSGFAHWMNLQAQEEVDHAMRFFNFLLERGARVELQALDAPPSEYGDPVAVMEKSLEHEKFVSSRIHHLYKLATEEGDYPAQVMLQWFVSEQVEEEASIDEIVERMKMFGSDGTSLLMVDTQLGARQPEAEEHE